MPPSIQWVDSFGLGTLSQGKSIPRLNAWTPKRKPIGPSVTGLGTGRIHLFKFREDDLISFVMNAIPGTDENVELMMRLQSHLEDGGLVTLTAGNNPFASNWTTATLAEGSEPDISPPDPETLEYTFSATLRSSSPSSSEFLPSFIPGLKLWLDATTVGSSPADLDFLSTWTDLSGNDNDAIQATSSKQPRWVESSIGGKPAVRFENGSSDHMLTPAIINPAENGATLFVVFRRSGAAVEHGNVIGFPDSTGENSSFSRLFESSNDPEVIQWTAATVSLGDVNIWEKALVAISFVSTATAVPYLNGVTGSSFDPPDFADVRRVNVGRDNVTSGNTGNFDIAEILLYEGVLATEDRESITTYLTNKYGTFVQEDTTPLTDLEGFDWTTWIAADQEAFANDDPVPTATDQSGSGHNATQATSGSRPLFKTGVINGLPAFYFDGTDDSLSFASGAFAGLTDGVEIFAVLKNDSNTPVSAQTGLWTMGSSGGANNTHYRFTDGHIYDDAGSTTRKDLGSPGTDLSVAHVYSVHSVNEEWIAQHNGANISTTSINVPDMASVVTLGKSIGAYYYKGHLAELLIGPKLSKNDRDRVVDFLKTKYAIT